MKKILTVIVALIFSVTSTFAGNGNGINSLISKHLNVPTELKGNSLNEKVNVQFKISENGKATVLNVETTNLSLKNYILCQLPKIDFNTVAKKKEAVYFVDINFNCSNTIFNRVVE